MAIVKNGQTMKIQTRPFQMARVARRMVDMLRSWLRANSCNVAPSARHLDPALGDTFRSTPLREGRPSAAQRSTQPVSIHAPARGATAGPLAAATDR